jgi:hypothetical protein
MPQSIIQQNIYCDRILKYDDNGGVYRKKKSKLAGHIVADVYSFFELTKKPYVNEKFRLEIKTSDHLENLVPNHLVLDIRIKLC